MSPEGRQMADDILFACDSRHLGILENSAPLPVILSSAKDGSHKMVGKSVSSATRCPCR